MRIIDSERFSDQIVYCSLKEYSMLQLLLLSLAPILIIAIFIYKRDKYEKEPIKMLLLAFAMGAIIVAPIIFVELYLGESWESKFSGADILPTAAFDAFVVAATTEELFKFLAFFIVIWRNKNFNEMFDGIVYAVFISLGFAAVENVLYVFQNGMPTGILRAFTAVPAHAVFGVTMGFFFAIAKFKPGKRGLNIFLALIAPIGLHGFYDFIIMSQDNALLLLFIPYVIFMIWMAFRIMKKHSKASVFKDADPDLINENIIEE